MRLFLIWMSFSLLTASFAEASKARMAVIGDAIALPDDLQELFLNPVKVFSVPDQLSLEFGPQGEGGLLRAASETTKFAVYVGHRNELYDELVNEAGNGLLPEQNPFEIFYGARGEFIAWGVSVWAAKGRDKLAPGQVDAQGFRAGTRIGEFEAYLHVGLRSQSKIDDLIAARMDSQYRLGGEYQIDDLTYFADVQSSRGRIAPSGGNEALRAWDEITLGFEHIEEDSEAYVFWGVKLVNTQTKRDPATEVTLQLPFYLGLESKMGEGVQWRAFLQQSMLLNARKSDPGNGAPATADNEGLNDTRAALGLSFQGGLLRIDGALTAAAATGRLTTDTLMTEVSLNYLF